MLIIDGVFYSTLNNKNNYEEPTKQCIENTVQNLLQNQTTINKPGMLLGKIQSGKTRTFIGITALAFDNGYDVIIVLTKGTKLLATQTYERFKREYSTMHEEDQIQLFDIMNLPTNLSQYELDQKLLLVVKKETNNLRRLTDTLFSQYPGLGTKRVLIIDDEADYASIGFSKTQQEILDINVIAGQIDFLRKNLVASDFLQVTATPYSLYLQPEELKITNSKRTFMPIRPAFTELVPIGEGYIGGEYYFDESEEEDSIASHMYQPIDEEELILLKKVDRRRLKLTDVLVSKRITSLRLAIVQFIVGGIIRRMQERAKGQREKKYSFIIHTQQAKLSHEWQETLVNEIKIQLTNQVEENPETFNRLVKEGYLNLKQSLTIINGFIPPYEEVRYEVVKALKQDYLMITKVNSEKDIATLLDENGQLKLRTPLNLFIGGQILDRGITISNLIGFYYGRNPRNFQQDTVLQHSRMFGYRLIEDLAVTRFYTTHRIYEAMKTMHEFDVGLREAFINGTNNKGVIFIEQDETNEIIPCSPNKLILSQTITLKPLKRMLPVGFQTGYKTNIEKIVKKIDNFLLPRCKENDSPFLIKVETAIQLMNLVKRTHDDQNGVPWDVTTFNACLNYLSCSTNNKYEGKVCIIVRKNRNIGRIREDGRFEDSPVYMIGEDSELKLARKYAKHVPVIIMTRQKGEAGERKWRGAEFWWPVLISPATTKTTIFSTST